MMAATAQSDHGRASRVGRPQRRALAALAAVTAALLAAAASAAAQVPPGSGPLPPGEPLYTFEIYDFKAVDESGYDWAGSDEVFVIADSTRGYRVRTSTYGDVDSGESRRIAVGERCLAPQHLISGSLIYGWLWAPNHASWDCRPRDGGVPPPSSLSMELWEDDPCGLGCFNPYWPEVLDPEDDLIGPVSGLTWSRSQLAAQLNHVGDSRLETYTVGGPCGHQEPGEECTKNPLSSSGPEYEITLLIRRVTAPLENAPG